MKTKFKKLLFLYFKGEDISKKRNNKAVSEILATILLLSISLLLLSIVYSIVLNDATSPSSTYHVSSAQIIASADEQNVVLQNNGGVPLNLNTKLIITIAGQPFYVSAKDYVLDSNGDGMWSIGEQINFDPLSIESLNGLEVTIKVINPDTNSMIMSGLVQEGARGDIPYVQTLSPYNVWPHSATLKSYYNFIKADFLPGKFWFQWKRTDDAQWNRTTIMDITAPLFGFNESTLYDLTSNKHYLYEAWIQYTSGGSTINQSGGIKLFTTKIDAMGIWHFDEPSGLTLFDSSGQQPPNDGTIKPNEIRGPQRVKGELQNHTLPTKCLRVDGIDDYGEVPNSNTLSVTNECTIEAWINRSEHCEGLIGTPIQSSLSQFGFYTSGCYDPCIINVTGTIYAVVSTNENSLGYIGTINITAGGDIVENISTSSSYLDVFNFDSSCKTPKIIKVTGSNGIVAIVYTRPSAGNRLYMQTLQIFNDGRINKTTISTSVLDASISYYPDIICINNNVYAIVYGITAANNGMLISVNISAAGTISPVNKKLFFGDIMQEPEIIKVVKSSDIYVIVYNCVGDDGGLRTVKITNTGTLSDISFHVWFDDDDGGSPEIINIKNDYYAIVYAGPILRQTGVCKTIEISSAGIITLSRLLPPLAKTIDQISFVSSVGNYIRYPHILALTDKNNMFGISYSLDSPTTNLYGKIVSVNIQTTGKFIGTTKEITFEPTSCSASYFFPIADADDVYGIVYRGESADGIIKTIWISNLGWFQKNTIIDIGELGGLKCYIEDEILTADSKYVADVFQGINMKMVLKTIAVNTIGKTVAQKFTDSFVIEPGYTSSNGSLNASYEPTIIWIKNNVYAIAYSHFMTSLGYYYGKIVTVNIDATGHISLIKRYTFDTNCMNTPLSFIPINKANGFYAIAYQLYSTSQGQIKTIKITDAGFISSIDSYIFESLRCREPSVVSVSGNIYAIIYRDSLASSTYGRLATLQIYGNNGTIKKSIIDLWQFTTSCYHPTIIKVNQNIFADAYSQYYGAPTNKYVAYVATMNIKDNGTITKSYIDSLEFIRSYNTDNYLAHNPKIIYVKDRVYAIISKDLIDPIASHQYYGWITTMRIGENGDIRDTIDGAVQISTNARVTSYDIKIIPFIDDSYIAIYGGKSNDLFQCVIRIPLSGTTQTILSKQGSYTLKANKTMVFVNFTDSNNQEYALSATLENNWNYIVGTYDKTIMKLYVNTNLMASLPLNNRQIKVTSNNLLFGPYNACYDEFSLYAAVLLPARILQNYNYYRPS